MNKQFRGLMSAQQIADGVNAALRNSRQLAEDARTLLVAGSHAAAASLAALSIEEEGKMSILRELALARDEGEAADAWRSFRNHSKKNTSWIIPLLAAQGARTFDDLRASTDPKSDHPAVLNRLKQRGFYTNYSEDSGWSEPKDAVDKKFAEFIVDWAERSARAQREVTTEEMDLWIEYLGPVWRTDMDSMRQALALWADEMNKRGLSDASFAEWVRGTPAKARPASG